jgi:hypothetical protein
LPAFLLRRALSIAVAVVIGGMCITSMVGRQSRIAGSSVAVRVSLGKLGQPVPAVAGLRKSACWPRH